MALSGPVTFKTVPPNKDRYGRVRAQTFSERWLQAALLEQGMARVAISPDRNQCVPDLYEAEQRGRARYAWTVGAAGQRYARA